MTLAFEDANTKLFEVVSVADVDDEDRVGNNLLQIWKLRFGHKVKLLFQLWAQVLIKILKLKFRQDFEAEVRSVFCCCCLVEVTKLNLGQYSEARFGQDLNLRFSRCLVGILKLMLSRDSEIVICSICLWTVYCDLVIWTQPSGPLCLWQCLKKIIQRP